MNTTADTFEHLPIDVQLSAYLDKELPEPLARQLCLRLQADQSLQATLASLKAGSEAGNMMFETLLQEPLPLSFARAIRRGHGIAAKLATGS